MIINFRLQNLIITIIKLKIPFDIIYNVEYDYANWDRQIKSCISKLQFKEKRSRVVNQNIFQIKIYIFML